MQLQPGEDWLVIRNCETSSASYLTLASGASPHVEMLTNVTGSIPDDELAQWFVDEDGLFTTGHNRFLLVGTLGAKHGGGEYEFHVRRWEIIAPVDRGTTLWNWLSPRSCLTDGDFR